MAEDKAFNIVAVEWDNLPFLTALEIGSALIIFLALGVLNGIFIADGEVLLASTTSFLQNLVLFAGLLFVGEKVFERVKGIDIFETIGWGQNIPQFLSAVVFGAVFAFLLTLSGQAVLIPQSVVGVATLNLLFIVIFAAFVEETFFAGSLLPTLNKTLQVLGVGFAPFLAIVFTSVIFGAYHFGAYGILAMGGSFFDPRVITSVFFRFIISIGNGLMIQFNGRGSTAFGYSAHAFNNLFALGVI